MSKQRTAAWLAVFVVLSACPSPTCPTCPAGQTCNPATGACEGAQPCRPGSCPTGQSCQPSGLCEPLAQCSATNCPVGTVCTATGCVVDPNRPPGNTCATVINLALDADGRAAATATSVGAIPDAPSQCAFSPRKPSIAFGLALPWLAKLKVTATPLDPGFDLGLSVGDGTCSQIQSVSCFTGGNGPGQAEVFEGLVSPADLSFVVLSNDGTSGRFTLEVEATRWSDNDTCDTAALLVLDGGFASVVADTRLSRPTVCPCANCQTHLVWRVSTVGLGERSLVATATALDGGYQPELVLTEPCVGGGQFPFLSCDHNTGGLTRARVDAPRLPEGEYFLRLGGADGGAVRLDVALGAPLPLPSNDTCATKAPLSFVASSSISVTGTTGGATDEDVYEFPCGALSSIGKGRDVFYDVVTPARGQLAFEVTPLATDFDPVLLAGSFCPPKVACINEGAAGGSEQLAYRKDDQPLRLSVDGTGNTSGPFQLTGTFTPAPANDQCSATVPLVGSVVAPSTGNTSDVFEDYQTCSEIGRSDPDLFYRLAPTANGVVTLTLQPNGFDGRLGLLASCLGTCLARADDGGVGVQEVLSANLARNVVYYVVVEGRPDGGTFTLSAQ